MPKPRRKKAFVVYMTISGNDIEIFNASTQSECKEFAEQYQQNNPNANLTVSPSPVFL